MKRLFSPYRRTQKVTTAERLHRTRQLIALNFDMWLLFFITAAKVITFLINAQLKYEDSYLLFTNIKLIKQNMAYPSKP